MPTFDVGAYLRDTDFTLEGIVSTKYPKGKAYCFPSPTAGRGMWMRQMVQLGVAAQLTGDIDARLAALDELSEGEELDLYREVMGSDTLDELLADGVSWIAVQRIFGLLLRHYATDQDIRTELQGSAIDEPLDQPATARPTPAKKAPAKKAPRKQAGS